jgi:hypothetical protein
MRAEEPAVALRRQTISSSLIMIVPIKVFSVPTVFQHKNDHERNSDLHLEKILIINNKIMEDKPHSSCSALQGLGSYPWFVF